jgi:uncharacterized membrane protein YfcA
MVSFLPVCTKLHTYGISGGSFTIDATLYKQILGVFLAIAILRMLNVFGKGDVHSRPINLFLALLIGSVIGLFSGMIGIGGGIILSPIIILLGWGNMKEAAAVSALFIFVNSVSGIMGFTLQGGAIPENSWYFIPVALVGGTFGAIYGSTKFNMQTLKYVLSGVLIIATIKLFFV